MSYEDRIIKPFWISPAGLKVFLKANEFSKGFSVNAEVQENLGDGEQRETFGASSEKYPINCIFFGDEHDRDADEFYKALKEEGTSLLQLPYGEIKYVTVGQVELKYNTVKGRNVTYLSCVFIEDVTVADDLKITTFLQITSMLHGLESETAAEFANTISSATTGEKTSIIDKFTSNLKLIGTKLKPITTATQEAVTKFTSIYTNIENNITEVLTEPLLLADQIMRLKEIPASFIGNFSELKNAYTTLFEASLPDLFSGSYFLNNAKKNEVSTQAFFASTAMIGMCQGFINATYTTKSEALLATEILLDSYKELTDYLETMQSTFEGARGTAEQFIIGKDFSLELASAINATIGNLLSLSQNLKREFSFQLTKDTTIINIAKEYYPEEFKQNEKDKNHNILENIIATNDLTNDEILLLPQGKMIKVYI